MVLTRPCCRPGLLAPAHAQADVHLDCSNSSGKLLDTRESSVKLPCVPSTRMAASLSMTLSSILDLALRQVKLQLAEEGWARRSEKTVLQALVRLADMHDALLAAATITE